MNSCNRCGKQQTNKKKKWKKKGIKKKSFGKQYSLMKSAEEILKNVDEDNARLTA